MSDAVQVAFCTCPDLASAERLAGGIVERRLAACVNLVPGLVSIYRWQGAIERADEVLLLIKTTQARVPALTAFIAAEHPYEVPELIVQPVTAGHAPYLEWVRTCTNND